MMSGSVSMGNRVVGSVRVAVRYVPEYRNDDDCATGPCETASVSSMDSHLASGVLNGMQARITRLQNSDGASLNRLGHPQPNNY